YVSVQCWCSYRKGSYKVNRDNAILLYCYSCASGCLNHASRHWTGNHTCGLSFLARLDFLDEVTQKIDRQRKYDGRILLRRDGIQRLKISKLQSGRALGNHFSGDRKSTRLNSSHVSISYAV